MKGIKSSYTRQDLRKVFSEVEDTEVENVSVDEIKDVIEDGFDEPSLTKEDIIDAVEAISKVADAVLIIEDKKDDEDIKVEEILDKVEDIVEVEDIPEEVVSEVVNVHLATEKLEDPATLTFDIVPAEGEEDVDIVVGDNTIEGFIEAEPVEKAEELIITPSYDAEEFEDKFVTIDSHWKDKSAEHKVAWDTAEKKFKEKNERDPESGKDYAAVMTIAKAVLKKYFGEDDEQYTEVAVSSVKPVLQALRKMIKSTAEEAYTKYTSEHPEMVEISKAIIEKRTPETEEEWAEAYADLTNASIDSSKKGEAYNLGYDAFKKGVDKDASPFEKDTKEFDEWIRGYNLARKEMTSAAHVNAPAMVPPKEDFTQPTVDKVKTGPDARQTSKEVMGGDGYTVFCFDNDEEPIKVKIGEKAVEISLKKVAEGIHLVSGDVKELINKVEILEDNKARLYIQSGIFGAIAVEGEHKSGIKNATYGVIKSDKNLQIAPIHNGSRGNVESIDVRTLVESAYVEYLKRLNNEAIGASAKKVMEYKKQLDQSKEQIEDLTSRLEVVKKQVVASKRQNRDAVDEFKQKMIQESFKRELVENTAKINSSVEERAKKFNSNVDFLSRMM